MVCTIQSFCFLYKKRTLGLKKNQVGLSTNDPGYRKGSFYFFQPSDVFYISILREFTICHCTQHNTTVKKYNVKVDNQNNKTKFDSKN